MSLNPLHELKRRLEDDSTPLPKRFCLAKNVIQSHYFPTAPKERVVADWLHSLSKTNKLTRDILKDVFEQLCHVENITGELKSKLIKIAADYLQTNPIQDDDIKIFLLFIENNIIATHLQQHINEYLIIAITLLQYLRESDIPAMELSKRIFIHIQKFYAASKKKLNFIIKFLSGENLETIFSFLHTECHDTVILLCSNVLFPSTKKSFYANFLQTLLRKDNIDKLIAEKGDNIQSVLKIMSTFFTFPNGRTNKDPKFLSDFIEVYVSCYREASQIIFVFYIMVASSLNMDQSYLLPAMKMPVIIFEQNEKIKRNLFLKMLETLLHKEIDINVRLTATLGEKISKVEIKKNFASFLQAVMMGQLKLEGKTDKATLQIIKTALKLDPMLIEQKMTDILPQIMVAKKVNTKTMHSYVEMMNCLLEMLFKLSRGITYVNQILPNLKICLEACNTEQFELKQKLKECIDNGVDCEKLKSKIFNGQDIFPEECVEIYGRCTSELMFRQNSELLLILQKDFEENCLMMLEEGFVSPSIIVMAEFLSAILCSYFEHSKMADHTVPQLIAENFWNIFKNFEDECLKKFGECVLKLNYNPPLMRSFLKLCLSYSQLKLLNINYSNYNKLQLPTNTSALDLSCILPCLDDDQWRILAAKIDDEAVLILNKLLVIKTMAMQITSVNKETEQNVNAIKNHLIKKAYDVDSKVFEKLDKSQAKILAKSLVKEFLTNKTDILQSDDILNNKMLLNALALETSRIILKCFENTETLTKALKKADFNISHPEIDFMNIYLNIKIIENQDDVILKCLEIFKISKIYFLEEMYQLTAILVLLTVKKCCNTKKIRRQVDYVLQSIFELSPKYPDVFKIFPVNFVFSFQEDNLMDLLTLKIKTSNQMLIVRSILELTVKKVKTDCEVVKSVVDILIKESNRNGFVNIEYFNDPAFQVACLILPIIAKEKKAITTSNYRSILANLQEELHKKILESFKNIDFSDSINAGNTESATVSVATLNAMDAFSLTLLKYCETNNADEFKKLDYLWSSLEYFTLTAIKAIENPNSKNQHLQSSIQLLNVLLRYIKKLEGHELFSKKDELFSQIWRSLKSRLFMVYDHRVNKKTGVTDRYLEDIVLTIKFLCELSSLECFSTHFVGELSKLITMKDQSTIKDESTSSVLTCHKVSNYFITQYLKANIVGPKGVAISKLVYNCSKKLKVWIHENYEKNHSKTTDNKQNDEIQDEDVINTVHIEDGVCEIIKLNINNLSEVLISAKKISLDYKFLDCTFELHNTLHFLLGSSILSTRCDVTWHSFFSLFEGSISVLNSLLVSREELLEDRWPCYMQCYRALVTCLCERSATDVELDKEIQEKLAEIAHSVEKLTQSMCKRKTQVSRLAAYTVADLCTLLANNSPYKMVRQHLENSVAILLQATDSTYAMAFLRRALAGSPAQLTMTRLYTMYKRYHKYVGNA